MIDFFNYISQITYFSKKDEKTIFIDETHNNSIAGKSKFFIFSLDDSMYLTPNLKWRKKSCLFKNLINTLEVFGNWEEKNFIDNPWKIHPFVTKFRNKKKTLSYIDGKWWLSYSAFKKDERINDCVFEKLKEWKKDERKT